MDVRNPKPKQQTWFDPYGSPGGISRPATGGSNKAIQSLIAANQPTPLPRVPTINDALLARSRVDEVRRRKGRSASILTGAAGVNNSPLGFQTLIGS